MDILDKVKGFIETKDADGLRILSTAELISLGKVAPISEAVAKKLPMDTSALAFIPYQHLHLGKNETVLPARYYLLILSTKLGH